MISGLSMIGYVATRWLGPGRGTVITGLTGGLVSSTAATLAFSRQSKESDSAQAAQMLAIGTLIAWAVMFFRVMVISFAVYPALLRELARADDGHGPGVPRQRGRSAVARARRRHAQQAGRDRGQHALHADAGGEVRAALCGDSAGGQDRRRSGSAGWTLRCGGAGRLDRRRCHQLVDGAARARAARPSSPPSRSSLRRSPTPP